MMCAGVVRARGAARRQTDEFFCATVSYRSFVHSHFFRACRPLHETVGIPMNYERVARFPRSRIISVYINESIT